MQHPKARIRPISEQEAARMQKEMKTKRLALVKLMEDSRAKLKSLLEDDRRPADKHRDPWNSSF